CGLDASLLVHVVLYPSQGEELDYADGDDDMEEDEVEQKPSETKSANGNHSKLNSKLLMTKKPLETEVSDDEDAEANQIEQGDESFELETVIRSHKSHRGRLNSVCSAATTVRERSTSPASKPSNQPTPRISITIDATSSQSSPSHSPSLTPNNLNTTTPIRPAALTNDRSSMPPPQPPFLSRTKKPSSPARPVVSPAPESARKSSPVRNLSIVPTTLTTASNHVNTSSSTSDAVVRESVSPVFEIAPTTLLTPANSLLAVPKKRKIDLDDSEIEDDDDDDDEREQVMYEVADSQETIAPENEPQVDDEDDEEEEEEDYEVAEDEVDEAEALARIAEEDAASTAAVADAENEQVEQTMTFESMPNPDEEEEEEAESVELIKEDDARLKDKQEETADEDDSESEYEEVEVEVEVDSDGNEIVASDDADGDEHDDEEKENAMQVDEEDESAKQQPAKVKGRDFKDATTHSEKTASDNNNDNHQNGADQTMQLDEVQDDEEEEEEEEENFTGKLIEEEKREREAATLESQTNLLPRVERNLSDLFGEDDDDEPSTQPDSQEFFKGAAVEVPSSPRRLQKSLKKQQSGATPTGRKSQQRNGRSQSLSIQEGEDEKRAENENLATQDETNEQQIEISQQPASNILKKEQQQQQQQNLAQESESETESEAQDDDDDAKMVDTQIPLIPMPDDDDDDYDNNNHSPRSQQVTRSPSSSPNRRTTSASAPATTVKPSTNQIAYHLRYQPPPRVASTERHQTLSGMAEASNRWFSKDGTAHSLKQFADAVNGFSSAVSTTSPFKNAFSGSLNGSQSQQQSQSSQQQKHQQKDATTTAASSSDESDDDEGDEANPNMDSDSDDSSSSSDDSDNEKKQAAAAAAIVAAKNAAGGPQFAGEDKKKRKKRRSSGLGMLAFEEPDPQPHIRPESAASGGLAPESTSKANPLPHATQNPQPLGDNLWTSNLGRYALSINVAQAVKTVGRDRDLVTFTLVGAKGQASCIVDYSYANRLDIDNPTRPWKTQQDYIVESPVSTKMIAAQDFTLAKALLRGLPANRTVTARTERVGDLGKVVTTNVVPEQLLKLGERVITVWAL
ncbi:hypothetical protein HDU80_011637, partial [Chytriomyces hyalinus]